MDIIIFDCENFKKKGSIISKYWTYLTCWPINASKKDIFFNA